MDLSSVTPTAPFAAHIFTSTWRLIVRRPSGGQGDVEGIYGKRRKLIMPTKTDPTLFGVYEILQA